MDSRMKQVRKSEHQFTGPIYEKQMLQKERTKKEEGGNYQSNN